MRQMFGTASRTDDAYQEDCDDAAHADAATRRKAIERDRDSAREQHEERHQKEAEETRDGIRVREPDGDDGGNSTSAEDECVVEPSQERARDEEQHDRRGQEHRSDARIDERLVDPSERRHEDLIDRCDHDPGAFDSPPVLLSRVQDEVVEVRPEPARGSPRTQRTARSRHASGARGARSGRRPWWRTRCRSGGVSRSRRSPRGRRPRRSRCVASGHPAPDHACDEDGHEGGCSFRAIGLQGSDDEDAHGEEGEPVAARLTRDVEEERRCGRQEEEEDARECAEPDVEPGRDDPDGEQERDRRPEPQRRSRSRRRPHGSPIRRGCTARGCSGT